MTKAENNNKADYDTKFSHNEEVFIKKGFFKRHLGNVEDVKENRHSNGKIENIEYEYTVQLVTYKDKKKILGEQVQVKEDNLLKVGFIAKLMSM